MSSDQAKKLAERFMDEQKQILEAHGDSVVRSKYKEAVAGAQRTFETLSVASVKLRAAQKV